MAGTDVSVHIQGPPLRNLLGCKRPSGCRGLAGHWRDFREFQAGDKHGCRRYSAPAVQFPASANEFGLRAQREVEDHLSRAAVEDRKSTRLNSSHRCISYAVFCLKKKKKKKT